MKYPQKTETEGQKILKATREVQQSIKDHIDAVQLWGPTVELGELAYPDLVTDMKSKRATLRWATGVSIKRAMKLTEEYAKIYTHPRLEIEFVGNYNIPDESDKVEGAILV